jgi:hypothetical protein
MERNEMRLRFYIAKLEQKLFEDYQKQNELLQLELKNKLASLYANDKEGYERALMVSGLYVEPDRFAEKSNIQIVKHKPLKSKL